MDIFDNFCGGHFPDNDELWDTDYPIFSDCSRSIVSILPAFILIILTPLYTASVLKNYNTATVKITTLSYLLKLFLIVFITLLHLCWIFNDILEYQSDMDRNVAPIVLVKQVILIVASCTSACLVLMDRNRSKLNGSLLCIYWLLSFISSTVILYSYIYPVVKIFQLCICGGWVFCSFGLFCTACVGEKRYFVPKFMDTCPEIWSSFYSKITYHWLNGTMWKGVKTEIKDEDLWKMAPEHEAYGLYSRFRVYFDKYTTNFQVSRDMSNANFGDGGVENDVVVMDPAQVTETTPLLGDDGTKEMPKYSLLKVLIRLFSKRYAFMIFLKYLSDVTLLLSPILQGYFIEYISRKDVHVWQRYFFAFLFFPLTQFGSFCLQYMFTVSTKLSVDIYSCLCLAIYEKSLKMSNTVDRDVGKVTNLMSVDAKDFQDTIIYSWIFLSAPFQLIVCSYILWSKIGLASLCGLGVILILIPINVLATRKIKSQQAKIMAIRDERIRHITQVFDGIKILKLYAWETSMMEKIAEIRNRELQNMKIMNIYTSVMTFIWTFASSLILLAIYVGYVLINGTLSAGVVFVTLSLVNIIRFPISFLPMFVSFALRTATSFKRMNEYFTSEEKNDSYITKRSDSEFAVAIKDASFGWDIDGSIILNNITMSVDKGTLFAVVGKVASGKSTLVQTILGETICHNGTVNVSGTVSYCAQKAWLQHGTVRENILFGSPFRESLYTKIIDACALKEDFEILVDGDMTEIGENGVNLSGGQKQRIALARAVYKNKDIYVFDDILSAVDANVGKHIFDKVLSRTGILKKKTRIFITNGLSYLPFVNKMIVLDEYGHVACSGTFQELNCTDVDFINMLKEIKEESDDEVSTRDEHLPEDDIYSKSPIHILQRRLTDHIEIIEDEISNVELVDDRAILVEKETVVRGNIKMKNYIEYIRQIGFLKFFSLIGTNFISQIFLIMTTIYLQQWSQEDEDGNPHNTSISTRLTWYGLIVLGQCIFLVIYIIIAALAFISGSRGMHAKMLKSIIRAPIYFFDSTPVGRVVNRFTKDMFTIDMTMPQQVKSFMVTFFGVVGSCVILAYSNYVLLAIIGPLFVVYIIIQHFYIKSSRQLKRLESTTRSPLFTKFSETLRGFITIRAFESQQRFMSEIVKTLNLNNSFYYASNMLNRWLAVRLDLIGNSILFFGCILAVAFNLNHSLTAMMVTYCLQITGIMGWMVRMRCDLESNAVSIERVVEYSDIQDEGELFNSAAHDQLTKSGWPSKGEITFESFYLRYRVDLPLALSNVNLKIHANEKIGIVGRTGSGKTTLAMSLFRINPQEFGKLIIDDVDISTIGLHQIRSSISIIPQDPVVFSISIRDNLDPNHNHTDEEIWDVLKLCHLYDFVINFERGIEMMCGEDGSQLSMGQKQLLCMGRALLRSCKILVLDEATASIDMHTDRLIQDTIHNSFKDCTILTVAHRINTIMDYDRILVMDNGKVAEFDTVENLKKKRGIFYKLLIDAKLI